MRFPGTAFEDISDDWVCPECGVGKICLKRFDLIMARLYGPLFLVLPLQRRLVYSLASSSVITRGLASKLCLEYS